MSIGDRIAEIKRDVMSSDCESTSLRDRLLDLVDAVADLVPAVPVLTAGGGPAFPCHTNPAPGKLANAPQGMSLRDYFAASALQGMIASSPLCDRTDPNEVNKPGWAQQAYGFADAMLAQRELPAGKAVA